MELRKTLVGQLSPRMALLTLFVSLTGLLQTAAGVTSYKVQKINPAGATTSYAIGINASNNVVGNYTTSTGVVLGYKFAAGKYTIIKFPTANKFTRANGINDAGLIVGDFLEKIIFITALS